MQIFVVIAFVLVFAIIFGIFWLFVMLPEQRAQNKLQKRMAGGRRSDLTATPIVNQEQPLSSLPSLNQVLAQAGAATAPLQKAISEAGLTITLGTFVLASACSAVLCYILMTFYTNLPWAGIVAGIMGSTVPYAYVRYARNRRLQLFEEQFPEAIDLIARTLRAGHAFTTGIELAGAEMPDPVGAEFKLLYDRQMFGQPLADALRAFAERLPIIDARFFVTAVLTQREAGGNLAEVLDNLGMVIRERFRVKRQVRVLSAHGRITGAVLSALPPVLAFLIYVRVPEQMKILIDDPIGPRLILVAVLLQIIGTLVIRKLVRIEY